MFCDSFSSLKILGEDLGKPSAPSNVSKEPSDPWLEVLDVGTIWVEKDPGALRLGAGTASSALAGVGKVASWGKTSDDCVDGVFDTFEAKTELPRFRVVEPCLGGVNRDFAAD